MCNICVDKVLSNIQVSRWRDILTAIRQFIEGEIVKQLQSLVNEFESVEEWNLKKDVGTSKVMMCETKHEYILRVKFECDRYGESERLQVTGIAAW